MLEQLDLFAAFEAEVKAADAAPKPVEKPVYTERKLVPPSVILQEDEPVDISAREVLREEAEKIAKANQAVLEMPELKPEIKPEPIAEASPEEPKIYLELPTPTAEELEELEQEVAKTSVFLDIRSEEFEKSKSTRGRKSIREMSAEADLPEVPEDNILYSKQYYGIGEVASMFKVNTSLIRYWESEFDILKPRKNGKGDRFFRPDDIKNLQIIYHLLRQKKYTIEGAKDHLKNNKKSKENFEMVKQLEQLKRFLTEMKTGLALS